LQNAGNLSRNVLYLGVYTWFTTGLLAVALIERQVKRKRGPKPPDDELVLEKEDAERLARSDAASFFRLGFTEAAMVLVSVCGIFAAFVAIQFVYLFGGQTNIANYSYAEYAHRGFTELILVAVLTLGLALVLNVNTIRRTPIQANVVRGLCTLLIALTAVILVSAFERLHLYELSYGLTSLRVQIYVLIGCLGFILAGFVLSMYWRLSRLNVFGLTTLFAAFGFVATLDILNPEYFVTWQNIQRVDFDPLYFSQLSEEAVPALVTLIDSPEPGVRIIVRYALSELRTRTGGSYSDWRDFNLDRNNAVAVLNNLQDWLDKPVSPSWQHPIEDFSTLHSGMTVREVIRQFGAPLEYPGESVADLYGEYSTQDNNLLIAYKLVDGGQVNLWFDSTTGLSRACLPSQSSCTPIPLAHAQS